MKTLASLLLVYLVATHAQAAVEVLNDTTEPQVATQQNVPEESNQLVSRIIPQGSVLISNYSGSDAWPYQQRTGYGLGVTMDIRFSQFVLETGLLYKSLGASVNDGPVNFYYTANYLSVPLEGKYYFSDPRNNAFFVKAGLLPAYLISQSVTADNAYYYGGYPTLNFKSFDLQALVGVGAKFNIENHTDLTLEVAYSRGFTSIDNSGLGLSIYNSAILFTVGLGFNL